MNTVTALLRDATEQAAIVIHLSACPLLPQIFAAETNYPVLLLSITAEAGASL